MPFKVAARGPTQPTPRWPWVAKPGLFLSILVATSLISLSVLAVLGILNVASAATPTPTPTKPSNGNRSFAPIATRAETPRAAVSPTLPPPAYVFPLAPADAGSYVQGHHDYPAVDIWAPEGTKFVAVTSGLVDFVSYEDGWDPGADDPATRGGLSVAIIGDDGVRYYGSHLSAIASGIAVGQRVTAGQVLGYVGHTGNARFISPQLHFGISHPTSPDDWKTRRGEIDPYPYLKAWETGEQITPALP
jgi:murein DD-endopeptidase MepM/ murein hydrolase activator NlpD